MMGTAPWLGIMCPPSAAAMPWMIGLPARPPRTSSGPRAALLDFRPILRNRSALAYSLAYCVHTWEMSALRAWVVTFLTFAAAQRAAGARTA